MPTLTMTGSGTLVLFDTVITDLANGDAFTIAFENDLVTTATGKNGNTIHALNEQGKNALCTVRVIKASSSDRLLQAQLSLMQKDFASYTAANGSAVGNFGDGSGVVAKENYSLKGGIFTRGIDGKNNVEGDVEQAIAIYTLRFANVARSIQ